MGSVSIESAVLAAAVKAVKPAVPRRIPMLAGVLVECDGGGEVHLTGTDGVVWVRATVQGDACGPVRACVPVKVLEVACRTARTVTVADDQVTAGGYRCDDLGDVAKFPAPPQVGPVKVTCTLPVGDWHRLAAVARDANQAAPALTAVNATESGAAASDSYRLVWAGEIPTGTGAMVPGTALRWMAKSGDATVVAGDRHCGYTSGTVRVTARLVNYDAPKVHTLVPTDPPETITITEDEAAALAGWIKRLPDREPPVRVAAVGGKAVWWQQEAGDGGSVVACTVGTATDNVGAAFNPVYLGSVATGGAWRLTDHLKPMLLPGALIMPVRVDSLTPPADAPLLEPAPVKVRRAPVKADPAPKIRAEYAREIQRLTGEVASLTAERDRLAGKVHELEAELERAREGAAVGAAVDIVAGALDQTGADRCDDRPYDRLLTAELVAKIGEGDELAAEEARRRIANGCRAKNTRVFEAALAGV